MYVCECMYFSMKFLYFWQNEMRKFSRDRDNEYKNTVNSNIYFK